MESHAQNMSLIIQWLFGSVVVLLYALDRFETPIPARGTTTFIRYWIARTGYIVSMFMLYLLLAGAFTDVAPILAILTDTSQQAISKELKELPGPLFAALILTSLLPYIPYLKRIDELVKRWFQRLGNIPLEVRALSGQLKHTRVVLSQAMIERLRDTLDELEVKEEWISGRENTFKHRWARIAALYASIREWDGTPAYMRYMAEHKSEFDEIVKQVYAVRELDENALATLDQDIGSVHPWRKRLLLELGALHQALCDFIAGGLLQGGWSPKQRHALLAGLGFEAASRPVQRLTAHDIFLVGGMIFLVMLFTSLFLNQNLQSTNLATNINMRVLFMVPIIYCVAIVAAIYPKAFWPFADIGAIGHRPVMGYVASGMLAAVATFVIQLLFRYVQGGIGTMISPGSFTNAFRTNLDRWPWILMNFLMTIAIAWAADNHALTKTEPRWLRVSETLGLACTCGLLQWVTLRLLLMFSSNPGRWDGRVIQMILTSTLVGAVIGLFVPHYCRKRSRVEATLSGERPVAFSGSGAPWLEGDESG